MKKVVKVIMIIATIFFVKSANAETIRYKMNGEEYSLSNFTDVSKIKITVGENNKYTIEYFAVDNNSYYGGSIVRDLQETNSFELLDGALEELIINGDYNGTIKNSTENSITKTTITALATSEINIASGPYKTISLTNGKLTIGGGTIAYSGENSIISVQAGTINLNGGTISHTVSSANVCSINNSASGTININNSDVTLNGKLCNSGTINYGDKTAILSTTVPTIKIAVLENSGTFKFNNGTLNVKKVANGSNEGVLSLLTQSRGENYTIVYNNNDDQTYDKFYLQFAPSVVLDEIIDWNSDGKFNLVDLVRYRLYLAEDPQIITEYNNLSSDKKGNLDLNNSGTIDLGDLMIARQAIIGIIGPELAS